MLLEHPIVVGPWTRIVGAEGTHAVEVGIDAVWPIVYGLKMVVVEVLVVVVEVLVVVVEVLVVVVERGRLLVVVDTNEPVDVDMLLILDIACMDVVAEAAVEPTIGVDLEDCVEKIVLLDESIVGESDDEESDELS
jgi:hypothetical protein